MKTWQRWVSGLVLGLSTSLAHATVITPIGAKATSEFGAVDVFGDGNFSSVFVDDLINGLGLIDELGTPDNILDDLQDNDVFWANGWHSGDFPAGIPGGVDGDGDWTTGPLVDQQVVELDLGGVFDLSRLHIWQQNQNGFFAPPLAPQRGVDQFRLLVSTTEAGDNFTQVGTFRLQPEEGIEPVRAQVLNLANPLPRARRVRMAMDSAQSGLPNEFIGFGEIRFEGTQVATVRGDFNGDNLLSAADIDLLHDALRTQTNIATFDVSGDGKLTADDSQVWVEQIRRTWYGDANLDGEFNSADFVVVFQEGQYEDATAGNSTWATGDWDGNRDFDSTDFVAAFQGGGFELGPRAAVAAVPEPAGLVVGLVLFSASVICRRRLRTR